MFVAGVLVWANLAPRPVTLDLHYKLPAEFVGIKYGWPTAAFIDHSHDIGHFASLPFPPLDFYDDNSVLNEYVGFGIAKNAFVALAILAAVAVTLELLARRRG